MRTLVVSDLHLGSLPRIDIARRADLRAPLLEAAKQADRVVLLGDALELRHGSIDVILRLAQPFFEDLGRTLGAGKEILLSAGNHDWGIVGPWLARRRADGEHLGLAETATPEDAGPLAERIAELVAPARLTLAYPGVWLRDDVYAMHGHYGDLNTLVPTFERLIAGAMRGYVAPPKPGRPVTVVDYEAAVAPTYAWMHQVAQGQPGPSVVFHSAGASVSVWSTITQRQRYDPRRLAMLGGMRAAVGLINRTKVGPVSTDIGPAGLRRAGLYGARTALEELDLAAAGARYAIFGHTHRSGPWPEDDRSEWRTTTGIELTNTGSWTYGRHWLGGTKPNATPYWPGTAAWVDDDGPPRLVRLLGYRTHVDLDPGAVDVDAAEAPPEEELTMLRGDR